jgi:hypothetical protein
VWLWAVLLLTLRWHQKPAIRYLWLWLVVVMGITIAGNAYADFLFHPRHVMGILPAVVLLFAYALLMIQQWRYELAALLLGVWVIIGFIHSLSPTAFMERIPSHVSGIPKSANDFILESGAACIAEDELAVYGLSTPVDADVIDGPISQYLSAMSYPFVQLSSFISDVENPSDLVDESIYDLIHSERVRLLTENRPAVWVFSLPDVIPESDLLDFNSLLLDADFVACGTVANRPDILAQVYSRSAEQCEAIIQRCNVE